MSAGPRPMFPAPACAPAFAGAGLGRLAGAGICEDGLMVIIVNAMLHMELYNAGMRQA
jgi:hypothetical protein